MKNFAYGSLIGAGLCNLVHIAVNQYNLLYGFGTVITILACSIIVACVKEV